MNATILHLLMKATDSYAAPDRPTVARCHLELRRDVADENWRRGGLGLPPLVCPSPATLRRRLARLYPADLRATRHGRAEARSTFAREVRS